MKKLIKSMIIIVTVTSAIVAGIYFINEYFCCVEDDEDAPDADQADTGTAPVKKTPDFEKTKRNYTRLNLSRK